MKKVFVNGYEHSDTFEINPILLGAGLFETIAIQNKRLVHWDRHMGRLLKSAQVLGMDHLNLKTIENVTAQVLNEADVTNGVLKLSWIKGKHGTLVHSFRDNPYDKEKKVHGFKLGLGSLRRNSTSYIVYHKTINYYDNILERKNIQLHGYDEALLLNTEGYIAEGTATNVFLRINSIFYTPSVECGLLNGIMRQCVIENLSTEGFQVIEKKMTLEECKAATEIYLTNALMGLMPVSNFNGTCYDINMGIANTLSD